jgi:hypothetical protein
MPEDMGTFRVDVGSLAELAYIFQLVKDLDLIEPAKWSELDRPSASRLPHRREELLRERPDRGVVAPSQRVL